MPTLRLDRRQVHPLIDDVLCDGSLFVNEFFVDAGIVVAKALAQNSVLKSVDLQQARWPRDEQRTSKERSLARC